MKTFKKQAYDSIESYNILGWEGSVTHHRIITLIEAGEYFILRMRHYNLPAKEIKEIQESIKKLKEAIK